MILLQSATGIAKCDDHCKVRQNTAQTFRESIENPSTTCVFDKEGENALKKTVKS